MCFMYDWGLPFNIKLIEDQSNMSDGGGGGGLKTEKEILFLY